MVTASNLLSVGMSDPVTALITTTLSVDGLDLCNRLDVGLECVLSLYTGQYLR